MSRLIGPRRSVRRFSAAAAALLVGVVAAYATAHADSSPLAGGTTTTGPPPGGHLFCAGTLTPTDPDHVITGTVAGYLKLSGGTWVVQDANVGGSITLTPGTSLMVSRSKVGGAIVGANGGELTVSNSNIAGAIVGATGEAVAVCSSYVSGALDAAHAPDGLQACASTMAGAIDVSGSTDAVMVGDAAAACPPNRLTSKGAILFANNVSGLDLSGNTMFGSLRVTNSGGIDPPVIAGNSIGGSIVCDGNVPPPVDSGQTNTVAGSRNGQCAAKQF